MSEKQANASIVFRRNLSDDHAIIRVAPDEGPVPDFEPGQYAEIAFPQAANGGPAPGPRLVRRHYSIASKRSAKEYLEFFVVMVKGGEFTPRLFQEGQGARLWLNPKAKGKFTLGEIPPGKDIVMVSTGTGLAPFVSMLREYHGHDKWRRLAVMHCARFEKDLGYRDELERYAAADPNFRYVPTLTREPGDSGWAGERCRVQELFEPERFASLCGFPLDPDQAHVLLCGNPAMIESTTELLNTHGFREHHKKNPGNIHLERYW